MKLGLIGLIGLIGSVGPLGCGTSPAKQWTDNDTKDAVDQANAALSLEGVCSRTGGPCPAAPVRSVESGQFCNAASMLCRHGLASQTPDATAAGIKCAPCK